MNPKEKANDLINKYIPLTLYLYSDYDWTEDIDSAKQCALIAVDEILEMIDEGEIDVWNRDILIYWQEVKQEMEKL